MRILILAIMLILTSGCGYSQEYNNIGVLNSIDTDKSFGLGQESIKKSILDSITNLNLYEYGHSLKELYELMDSNKLTLKEWNSYINVLLKDVFQEKKDTLRPFYAVDYKGLIPLRAEFFISSLEMNIDLRNKYPHEYQALKESTSKLLGKGYSMDEVDSLLVVFPRQSTVGTVNFWYFVQLYGCPIIEMGVKKTDKERIGMLMRNLDITSTYKVPLQLQLRKVRCMNRKIQKCLNEYHFDFKPEIIIMDEDKDYYKKHLKEGLNLDKMKEF